ncbi:MAG: hypothetical protein EPN84_08845 [Legionella sp.]|nr:MAG: hypothetical protein EPN84_08845 [Legionella sp.]
MKLIRTVHHKNNTTDTMEISLIGKKILVDFTINQPGEGRINEIQNKLRSNLANDGIKQTSNTWDIKTFHFTSELIDSDYVSKAVRSKALVVLGIIHEYCPFNKKEIVEIAQELYLEIEIVFEVLPKPKMDNPQDPTLQETIEQLTKRVKDLEAAIFHEPQLEKNNDQTASVNQKFFNTTPK